MSERFRLDPERLRQMGNRPVVEIIGVPMDLGGNRRGVDMGPSGMRYAGLADKLTHVGGEPTPHNVVEIVRACEELADVVSYIVRAGNIPLVLGGDHSMAMGTIAGLDRAGKRAGVIWIDAHGDSNTPESSPSMNVHGMPFAVSLGLAG